MDSDRSESTRSRFFVLCEQPNSEFATEFVQADPFNLGDAPRCRHCGRYLGLKPWLAPHRAELVAHGQRWGDLVFGSGVDLLVSSRFMEAWKKRGMVGLVGFESVQIVRAQGPAEKREYYHVDLVAGEVSVDEANSSIDRVRPITCDVCRASDIRSISTLALDENQWQGEDIFVAKGLPGFRIASERFLKLVNEVSIRNAFLTPVERFTWPRPSGN